MKKHKSQTIYWPWKEKQNDTRKLKNTEIKKDGIEEKENANTHVQHGTRITKTLNLTADNNFQIMNIYENTQHFVEK